MLKDNVRLANNQPRLPLFEKCWKTTITVCDINNGIWQCPSCKQPTTFTTFWEMLKNNNYCLWHQQWYLTKSVL